MGPSRKVHFLHGMFQVAGAFGAGLAVLTDLARAHRGVCRSGRFFEPLQLDTSGGDHALPDGFRRFAGIGVGGEFAEIDQRDPAVDVDPVQQ